MDDMPLLPDTSAVSEPGFAETVATLFPLNCREKTWRLEEDVDSRRRRKLWEISAGHHCIVIGTCISMPELRRLARRAGVEQWNTASDYELHHDIAVSCARERTRLSTLMHKDLERKFALAIRRFANAKSDGEIRAWWKEALARGDVAGALWAIMTHPMASEQTLCTAGEELHMLSHQMGASNRADLQRLAEFERENQSLKDQLQRHMSKSAGQIAQKDALITALETRVAEAAAAYRRCEQTEARLRELEDKGAVAELQRLVAAESRRAQRAAERAGELAGAAARCVRLERELAHARRECEAAECMLQSVLAQRSSADGAPPHTTGAADFDGRCVLCVGGRTGLVEQYRLLVEHCGGEFLHHDGGLEDNSRRLQALLASAAAMVCVAGNISHGAYYAVKRYCKQNGKPCVLLKNGSLSSFANGIRALSGGAFHAGAGDTVLVKRHDHDTRRNAHQNT